MVRHMTVALDNPVRMHVPDHDSIRQDEIRASVEALEALNDHLRHGDGTDSPEAQGRLTAAHGRVRHALSSHTAEWQRNCQVQYVRSIRTFAETVAPLLEALDRLDYWAGMAEMFRDPSQLVWKPGPEGNCVAEATTTLISLLDHYETSEVCAA